MFQNTDNSTIALVVHCSLHFTILFVLIVLGKFVHTPHGLCGTTAVCKKSLKYGKTMTVAGTETGSNTSSQGAGQLGNELKLKTSNLALKTITTCINNAVTVSFLPLCMK